MRKLKKCILYFYTYGTRAVVKDLSGRTYMDVNLATKAKARSCARSMWWGYQKFVFRVLFTGRNKNGVRMKL